MINLEEKKMIMQHMHDINSGYKDIEMHDPDLFKSIPILNFPTNWGIKIIPPTCGAVVRFLVHEKNAIVSVYLDRYDMLAIVGKPYWEFYPYEENDVYRCAQDDTKLLLSEIQKELDRQNKSNNPEK